MRYVTSDLVQWKGGEWIATADTIGARPGAGESPWRLFTKPGRDGERGEKGEPGKDGRDASPVLPGRGW